MSDLHNLVEEYRETLGKINKKIDTALKQMKATSCSEQDMKRYRSLLDSRDDLIYAIREMEK